MSPFLLRCLIFCRILTFSFRKLACSSVSLCNHLAERVCCFSNHDFFAPVTLFSEQRHPFSKTPCTTLSFLLLQFHDEFACRLLHKSSDCMEMVLVVQLLVYGVPWCCPKIKAHSIKVSLALYDIYIT